MKRRYRALLLVPFALLIAGCGQVEQTVNDAADEAVSDAAQTVEDAASDATQTAAGEVVKQICKPLQDGRISAGEQQMLSGLVSSAESAGIPNGFVDPLHEIAEAGDQVPAESVEALRKKCSANSGK